MSEPRQSLVIVEARKPYGFFSFLGDLFMLAITGGLWIIWIFVREMRRR
jgi:hypothetical protein